MPTCRYEHNRPGPSQRFRHSLIKAPGATRHFVRGEGETITITDKSGKELWSFKNPQGQGNPGVIIYDVQIDLCTERDFGHFCQKTWTRGQAAPPSTPPPTPTANPS
jgi:hypothetical protein